MTSARRSSPFLVLGVPFASGRDVAAKGFARAVRRLRGLEDPPFDLEDLNWAQHEIEHRSLNAEESLNDFRVPADPSAYELNDASPGARLTMAPRPLPRRSPPTAPDEIEALRSRVIIEVLGSVIGTSSPVTLPASFSIEQE